MLLVPNTVVINADEFNERINCKCFAAFDDKSFIFED